MYIILTARNILLFHFLMIVVAGANVNTNIKITKIIINIFMAHMQIIRTLSQSYTSKIPFENNQTTD